MKRLRIAFLIVLSFIAFSACGEPQSTENSEKSAVVQSADEINDLGYQFEDGLLTVDKIYYTVLDVVGKPRCVYQEPWVSYKNRGEISEIIIDADMVYTTKNIMTGEEFSNLSEGTGDFFGGGVLFGNMDSLKSLTIRRLNLGGITDISDMFANNENLKSVDASGLMISDVTDISRLFYGAEALESINLNSLDTARVIKAEGVFENCSSLRSVGVSSWNTSNIKNFRHFFARCSSLPSVDLSGWTVNNADVSGMFWGCEKLSDVKLTNVTLTDTITANPMFDEHNSLSSYLFSEDWTIEDVQPISDDVYYFIVVPMVGDPNILFIEYIYYTKTMPEWYKDYVAKIQAVEDCIGIRSPALDIYIKGNEEARQAAGDFTFDDVKDVALDTLANINEFDMKNATDEEREIREQFMEIKDDTDMLDEIISIVSELKE